MLQRLGIRGKLLAVVAVPTIVLLLAASFVVLNAASAYTNGRDTTQLVDLVETGSPLISALQAERADVSGYLRATSDGDAARLTARTNVDTTITTLKKAGDSDPAFATIASQISAAVAGTNGNDGLVAARAVGPVASPFGDFATWPDATKTQSVSDTFDRVAQEVTDIANTAPVSDMGNVVRGLPALIRFEGKTVKAYLDDSRTAAEALPAEFGTTDRVGSVFVAGAARIKPSANNEGVIAFLNGAASGLQALSPVRDQVRAASAQPGPAVAAYTTVITDLLGATSEVANIAGDRTLSIDLKGYVSMGQLVEALRNEEVYVSRKLAQGSWRFGEQVQYQQYYFGSNNALANAQAAVALVAGVTSVPKFGASYDPRTIVGFETIRDRIINDPTTQGLISQQNNEWPRQVNEEIAVYSPIISQLTSDVNGRAASVERNSLIQTLATALIAVIAVAASLFVALAISRRIVNPLRRLTTTATAVRQELPRLVERVAMPGQSVDVSEVQIPVESQDEVGRLAEAFNSVNAATLAIASEQAALRGSISEMFVNVARRDQVLLNRQLASIDEMERTEDNQDTLTKLFALDHLATRMRRNSESLLVLAGIDTGRRLRRPMPLSDVIRTASSEIELYERIQLELDADPAMLGHSALTAAHLFAELLENATVFSDPGTQVIVRTLERDGAFVVTISDQGIGMTSEELAEANSRVASTAASEILGAQRLGLFVVGRIARRVGARVHLESGEGQGTEATVVMPTSLFDASVGYAQGHSSGSTADESLHAPAALVHHDASSEEVSEPVLASRGLSAYQPTVIEDGANLAERPAEAAEVQPQPSPLPARGVPEPASPRDLDQIVAADAADAPAAVAFDLDEYTEGVNEVGLPTRRRRSAAGAAAGSRARARAEASQDTNSIIALPQRASDEQLSALQSATTSGFTPILAADEVSPESAEARARVFRGFRPLRSNETEPEALASDAESLGHAMRRGAGIGEEPVDDSAPAVADSHGAEAFEPEDGSRDRASDVMRNFAADAADRDDPGHRTVRQSPLITSGYVEDNSPSAADARVLEEHVDEMLVPKLEDDDEPVAVAPVYRQRPAVDDRWNGPHDGEAAGVDSVSLDETPQQSAPVEASVHRSPLYPAAANPWQQQVPQEVQSQAAPVVPNLWQQQVPQEVQSQAAPVAPDDLQQQGPREAQFEADPVASVPSLDDLIMDGAGSARGSEEHGGFFSRLFGKQSKREPVEAPTAPPMQFSEPQAPVAEPVTLSSAPAWAIPAPEPEPEPEPRVEQVAPQPFGATSLHEAAPQENSASAEELAAHEGYRDDFSPVAPAPAPAPTPAPEPEPVPVADPDSFGPSSGETPVADEDHAPQWTMLPPLTYPTPSPYAEGQGFAPAPGQPEHAYLPHGEPPREEFPEENTPEQGAPVEFGHDHMGTVYSPDQLASPLGWETAGASALQAAAPESATEYRPVVQISPGSDGPVQEDFASAVFSELSSLAAERPKVETTRAGLAKRTPVAREEVPEESAQSAPSAPRDAEAVRRRFSAFYSGTQRAKDDVQSFNDSTQGSLTEP